MSIFTFLFTKHKAEKLLKDSKKEIKTLIRHFKKEETHLAHAGVSPNEISRIERILYYTKREIERAKHQVKYAKKHPKKEEH